MRELQQRLRPPGVLSLNNQPISAVYHATNGGMMAAGPEAWAMQPSSY